VLTMVVVPVFYAILFRIKLEKPSAALGGQILKQGYRQIRENTAQQSLSKSS
jgi:hypothetical protein